MITRYAYKNTYSEAGSPENIEFDPKEVYLATCWTNSYGNPTYCLYLNDDTTLLCVDDYGAMNEIYHLSVRFVSRKKDL